MITNFLQGDSFSRLLDFPDKTFDVIVTSPPYLGLRNYGAEGQIGLEPSINEYINNLVKVFKECSRVLKDEGTLWINIGDTFAGTKVGNTSNKSKPAANTDTFKKNITEVKNKSLCLIPHRLALALLDEGLILRDEIHWLKTNCAPESVKDRCTRDYEYLFRFVKQPTYFYRQITEPCKTKPPKALSDTRGFTTKENTQQPQSDDRHGKAINYGEFKNMRTTWQIPTQAYSGSHCATFPLALVDRCLEASCPEGGHVLDPFSGAGTTALVCAKRNLDFTGIELNPQYIEDSKTRLEAYRLTTLKQPV